MWSLSTNVTDGQMGGQTDDMRKQDRAMHYSASRGKNHFTVNAPCLFTLLYLTAVIYYTGVK